MAKSIYGAPVSRVYGQNFAIATPIAYGDIINIRKGFKGLQFYCASAFKFLTTPRIGKVWLWDDSIQKYADHTAAAVDNDADTEVLLGTMTTSDILYVGCVDTFLGLSIDIGTANSNSSTTPPDVEYWNGSEWTDVGTDADGTKGNSTSFAVGGLYTWALPSDWKSTSVNGSVPLYFIRFIPLATLSAGTSIDGLVAINKGTDYAYFPAAMAQDFNYDEDLVGGLQFLATTGTPTVYINWIEYKG